jgi:hypothetical protein
MPTRDQFGTDAEFRAALVEFLAARTSTDEAGVTAAEAALTGSSGEAIDQYHAEFRGAVQELAIFVDDLAETELGVLEAAHTIDTEVLPRLSAAAHESATRLAARRAQMLAARTEVAARPAVATEKVAETAVGASAEITVFHGGPVGESIPETADQPLSETQMRQVAARFGLAGRFTGGIEAPASVPVEQDLGEYMSVTQTLSLVNVRSKDVERNQALTSSGAIDIMSEAFRSMPIPTTADSRGMLPVFTQSRLAAIPTDLQLVRSSPNDNQTREYNEGVIDKVTSLRAGLGFPSGTRLNGGRSNFVDATKRVAASLTGDMSLAPTDNRMRASLDDFASSMDNDVARVRAALALCGPGNQSFDWVSCLYSGTPVQDNIPVPLPIAPGDQNLPLSRYKALTLADATAVLGPDLKWGNKDCPDGSVSNKSCFPLPNYCGTRIKGDICAYYLCTEWSLFQEFSNPGIMAVQMQMLDALYARWYEQLLLDWVWSNSLHTAVTPMWNAPGTIFMGFIREVMARVSTPRLGMDFSVDLIVDFWLPYMLHAAKMITPAYVLPDEVRNIDSPAGWDAWLQALPGVNSVTYTIDGFSGANGSPVTLWPTPAGTPGTASPNSVMPSKAAIAFIPAGGIGRLEGFEVDYGFMSGGVFSCETIKRNAKCAFKEKTFGFYPLAPMDCFAPGVLVLDLCDSMSGQHPIGTAIDLCVGTV